MSGVQNIEVTGADDGMRLDRWFRQHYPQIRHGELQKLLRKGQVRVDGGRVKADRRLTSGETVRVPPVEDAQPVQRRGVSEQDARFIRDLVIYEDDSVIALNKPFGIAVQGGAKTLRHIDGMLDALTAPGGERPRLVHRLDRETSGIILVAKTRKAAQELTKAFRHRNTRKIYWALVKGVPKPKQGRISTWLAKEDTPDGDRMRVTRQGKDDASHAVSLYSVVDNAGQQLAWLSMRPVTGRTHQLRAHAAHIGHPIVGDPKYFDVEDWQFPGGIQNKLHLHARRIVIPHPAGGKLDVTAPLPPHMQQSWNLLGFDIEAGSEQSEQEDA